MADKIEAASQKADDFIMDLCSPKAMSQASAIDFLERVIFRCQSAIEALREEMGDLE